MKKFPLNMENNSIFGQDNPKNAQSALRFELFDSEPQDALSAEDIASRVDVSREQIRGLGQPKKDQGKDVESK
jgi:biotin operon repressor